MKNAWSKALLAVAIGQLLSGVQAPATYLNKNIQGKSDSQSPSAIRHRESKDDKQAQPTSLTNYDSSTNDELARNFIREVAGFKSNKARDRVIDSSGYERSAEFASPDHSEEYPMHSDEIPDDYPTFPTHVFPKGGSHGGTKIQHSGQNYYGSDLEDELEDDGGYHKELLNYEVTETIPGDTKYKKPKLPVVPVPPPCPSLPGPPRPPILDQARRAKPIRYYMKSRGKGRVVYQPYIIRKVQYPAASKGIIVRHKTVPIPAPPLRTQSPPPLSLGRTYHHHTSSPTTTNHKLASLSKTAKIIKEVHIHHHHPAVMTSGTVIPVAVAYKTPAFPSDGYQSLATSTRALRFSPISAQQSLRVATGGGTLSGHFAEPPPFTTIGYI